MELCPYLFCLFFCLLYFFLPPFEDNGLLFWVPDVLCWHSEVVLWNLLSVEMFFWWIFEGESGLPVLFLHHLRTAPWVLFLFWLHPYLFCLFFLSFIFFPISFRRQWAAFLGAWCPLPAFRSCFVEFTQRSNVVLMNLWGRKWSPCPIPPPS